LFHAFPAIFEILGGFRQTKLEARAGRVLARFVTIRTLFRTSLFDMTLDRTWTIATLLVAGVSSRTRQLANAFLSNEPGLTNAFVATSGHTSGASLLGANSLSSTFSQTTVPLAHTTPTFGRFDKIHGKREQQRHQSNKHPTDAFRIHLFHSHYHAPQVS
jgi:hypothetical protein